ncbi:FAD/FMN-containing dehydrogenase [Tamaricihabitans halophyticus]|uniref:FAD/FMN-containing dehydrogenase n=1 Tax=Tamaricihabitans halophyticus TaxID=1262583 RepID=A0A4R2QW90_9PSEU|nr:FAD-binding oxidoreductase [Tamaricihabitans halophyticus]TCP54380.1 FAD/FMN-containing dehydrogenase [Tamaricihabitans halophyticus]
MTQLQDDLDSAIRQLRGTVTGPVVCPGEDGYEDECAGTQTAWGHRPVVAVGARAAADVRAAVSFAAERGLPVAVQATGHGQPESGAGGVLISTRRMAEVSVDPARGTAWIGAGTRWREVIDAAAPHGLAPLSGSTSHVGAVSYTLGGGIGLLARRYGYAVDQVRTIDVVTADGMARRCTPDTEPDLFWALCGGRGNFGVVTALEVGLVPAARLYGGGLYFDAAHAPAVLAAWLRLTRAAPDELTTSLMIIPFPDLPDVPEPFRGKRIVHVRVAYLGDAAVGDRLVGQLRAVVPPLVEQLADIPFTDCDTIHRDPTDPHAFLGTSVFLRDLDEAALAALLDATGPAAPAVCLLELRHLGGALANRGTNAVGFREAGYLLGVVSPLDNVDLSVAERGLETAVEAVRPWILGRHLNGLFGAAATPDQVSAAFEPADYRRLAELKARYDTENLFRHNHNIPPARGTVRWFVGGAGDHG